VTRTVLAIGLLLGTAVLLSTALAQEAEPPRLKGTRVSLTRPKFFVRTEFGNGYEFPNGAARIQVTEIARPLDQMLAGYSDEVIESSNAQLKERTEVEIDGYPGLYLRTVPKPGYQGTSRWIAVFGNDEATVVIDATGHPGSDEALEIIYRETFLGARWDPELEFSPYEGLPFILAGSSRFEFASRYGAALTFTLGGKVTRDSPDDPILVVTTVSQKIAEEDRGDFCAQRIQASPVVENIELVASGAVEADGIRGCEAVARARDRQTGRPMMIYEANLFERGRFYNFNGVAGVRFRAEYVTEFARAPRRIRRK
jgi:hypothetical protein